MAMLYPLIRRIHSLSATLVLLAIAVTAYALTTHLTAPVAPAHQNAPLQRGLTVIASAIVPVEMAGRAGTGAPVAGSIAGEPSAQVFSARCPGENTRKQLATLDARLRALGSGPHAPGLPTAPYRIDPIRLEAHLAMTLDRPALDGEAGIAAWDAGLRFRCSTLSTALAWIERNGLTALRWRTIGAMPGTSRDVNDNDRYVASAAAIDTRWNPWRAPSGCVFLEDAGRLRVLPQERNATVGAALCARALDALNPTESGRTGAQYPRPTLPVDRYRAQLIDERALPISIGLLRSGLAQITMPGSVTNSLEILGNRVQQTPHVVATIDPNIQDRLQSLAECYTGRPERCDGAVPIPEGRRHYEDARARMVGVLLLDIRSGEIVAAASADTPCFRSDYSGGVRDAARCPDLPSPPRHVAEMLENHALYFGYRPGSLVKPMMALGMLRDTDYAKRITGSPREESDFIAHLATSNSPAFLDRFLCAERGYRDCARPDHAWQVATDVGLNGGCIDGLPGCGRYGLIGGTPAWSATDAARERLSTEAGIWGLLRVKSDTSRSSGWEMIPTTFDAELAALAAQCAQYGEGKSRDAWRTQRGSGCGRKALNALREAGLGQGDARMTPIGVALMLAHMGNASLGRNSLPLPHLFRRAFVIDDGRRIDFRLQPATAPVRLDRAATDLVLEGMRGSSAPNLRGTAQSACLRAFTAGQCNTLHWVAGKTGTPGTSRSLRHSGWRRDCGLPARADNEGETLRKRKMPDPSSCAYQSVKWYAALIGDPQKPDSDDWRHALVVVVQRNWLSNGGLPEDNPAAELAFQYLQFHAQPVRSDAR